ncbi:MAG: conjugal transfer protein TraI [Bacteroidota bacterium]|nr:conjugal transfer protein TraI [Bacteroidota bacterium]MDP4256402.1 conjugal transfer protein TraI [Bacteroidota bacterium]MDP4260043.1 conjugal transfer protein TraI [Bacteroidota bacterium]
MKKAMMIAMLILLGMVVPGARASAQIEVIEEVIKEIIMAIDLGIQKVQTETIALQDAQKMVENAMQQTHLNDITDWVQKQKDLYQGYYRELWEIKEAIAGYKRVKDLIAKQVQLVSDYRQAYSLVGRDKHFSADELAHIYHVYDGILAQSVENVGALEKVINAFLTQMDDADRLRIIDETGRRIDKNSTDLRQFTQENIMLSLQRSRDQSDLQTVRSLYGLQ